MSSRFCGDSRALLTLAVSFAILLAQDRDEMQLETLAAFFTLLGSILDLLALQPDLFRGCTSSRPDTAPNCGAPQDR